MKKILIILLCFPMIGFGQNDCGWNDLSSAPFLNNYKHDDIFFINPAQL